MIHAESCGVGHRARYNFLSSVFLLQRETESMTAFLGICLKSGCHVLRDFAFHKCSEETLDQVFENVISGVNDCGDGFMIPQSYRGSPVTCKVSVLNTVLFYNLIYF